jgi:hypothetical protein
MASVRMIYIDEKLNKKLKKYGNASKLISELLNAYFSKTDPSSGIPLISDTELSGELNSTYQALYDREATPQEVEDYLNDFKQFGSNAIAWVSARERRKSTPEQSLLA